MAQLQEVAAWKPFLKVFTSQIQALEDAAWDMYTKRGIDTAEGVQLDNLGKILIEPRAGDIDGVYRQRLKAKVRVLRSSGTMPDLIDIYKLLLPNNDIFFSSFGEASFMLELGSIDTAAIPLYQRFLRLARAAGVDGQIHIVDTVVSTFFTYDNTSGTNPNAHGYADTAGAGGSQYTGVIV